MGYYSDVGYAIRFKTDADKDAFIALIAARGGYEYEALKECEVGDCTITFRVNEVKWYSHYPDVKGHDSLLIMVDGEFNDRAGYAFVRIGERNDDIKETCGGHEGCMEKASFLVYAQVVREVVFDTDGLDLCDMSSYIARSHV